MYTRTVQGAAEDVEQKRARNRKSLLEDESSREKHVHGHGMRIICEQQHTKHHAIMTVVELRRKTTEHGAHGIGGGR
jgi:hypothetical protein